MSCAHEHSYNALTVPSSHSHLTMVEVRGMISHSETTGNVLQLLIHPWLTPNSSALRLAPNGSHHTCDALCSVLQLNGCVLMIGNTAASVTPCAAEVCNGDAARLLPRHGIRSVPYSKEGQGWDNPLHWGILPRMTKHRHSGVSRQPPPLSTIFSTVLHMGLAIQVQQQHMWMSHLQRLSDC